MRRSKIRHRLNILCAGYADDPGIRTKKQKNSGLWRNNAWVSLYGRKNINAGIFNSKAGRKYSKVFRETYGTFDCRKGWRF